MTLKIIGILEVFVTQIANERFAGRVGLDLNCLYRLMIVSVNCLELRLRMYLLRAAHNGLGAADYCLPVKEWGGQR